MPNGNVQDYVGENLDTNRLQLVRRLELNRSRVNKTLAIRNKSRFIVISLARDRARRFERGTYLFRPLLGLSRWYLIISIIDKSVALPWFQVLNSSLNDSGLRSRYLRS